MTMMSMPTANFPENAGDIYGAGPLNQIRRVEQRMFSNFVHHSVPK